MHNPELEDLAQARAFTRRDWIYEYDAMTVPV
jgi:hypothetical protein